MKIKLLIISITLKLSRIYLIKIKIAHYLLLKIFLENKKEPIKEYFARYYKYFKLNIKELKSLDLMKDADWLYFRTLDKFLWYYYKANFKS